MTDINYRDALINAIEQRKSFEASHDATNDNIQDTLTKLIKECHDKTCETLASLNVDVAFINRHERANKRFNVYAAQKVTNIARYLNASASLNHYTRAIVETMLALEAAKLTLTQADAQAACSLDVKVKDNKKTKLIKRYQKHVAASTAATQSSSSLNALQVCNVIRESRNDANETIYMLNDNTSAKALLEKMNAKA